MTSDTSKGSKPFPSARTGASDDDIFAEMGRMLAQDQGPRPRPATQAPAEPPPAPPKREEPPLELTQVVARGRGHPGPERKTSARTAQPDVTPTPRGAAVRMPPIATPSATAASPPAEAPTKPPAATSAPVQSRHCAASEASVQVSTRSLDEIVEAALRPMIQEWLDQNLERIVREQLADVAAGAEKSE
jgi:uncharacterized protein